MSLLILHQHQNYIMTCDAHLVEKNYANWRVLFFELSCDFKLYTDDWNTITSSSYRHGDGCAWIGPREISELRWAVYLLLQSGRWDEMSHRCYVHCYWCISWRVVLVFVMLCQYGIEHILGTTSPYFRLFVTSPRSSSSSRCNSV